jgi:O-antigen ligase
MASTVFLSGSRGGMLSLAVEMSILATVLGFRRHRRRAVWLVSAFLAILVVMLLWLGGSTLMDRLASIDTDAHKELASGVRLTIDRDALRMFARKPLFGWGLGTFPEVYPQFRSFYTDDLVDQAHNDYLQLLVETGTFGFVIMLWFIVLMYRCALRKLQHWERDVNGAVALAALLGCSGILVHSFVDFNLQIPANAALFYVLATLAAMPPVFGASRRRGKSLVHDQTTAPVPLSY